MQELPLTYAGRNEFLTNVLAPGNPSSLNPILGSQFWTPISLICDELRDPQRDWFLVCVLIFGRHFGVRQLTSFVVGR